MLGSRRTALRARRAGDRGRSCRGARRARALDLPEARRAPLPGDLDRDGRGRRSRSTRDGAIAARGVAVGACSAVAQRLPALEARLRRASRRRRRSARRARRRPRGARARSTTSAGPPPTAAMRRATLRAPRAGASSPVNERARASSAPRPSRFDAQRRSRARSRATRASACPTCCATSSASPAPRSAATPATAAPAPCCSTASRCAPAWSPLGQVEGRARDDRRRAGARTASSSRCSTAFLAHGAAQCGICTPGMLMAADRPAARKPAPDRSRGAGRARRRAVPLHRLPQDRRGGAGRGGAATSAAAGSRRPGSAVGARAARKLDGAPKVAGTRALRRRRGAAGRAVAARRPLAACPRALRARRPRAAACARIPGSSTCSPRATCRTTRFGDLPRREGPAGARRRPRALPRRGGAGAGRRRARRSTAIADAELPIAWRPQTPLTDDRRGAGVAATPACTRAIRTTCSSAAACVQGDVDAALARGAARGARATFTTSFVEHAYIEPEAGYAEPRSGDRIRIFACTQTPYMDRDEIARVLGCAPDAGAHRAVGDRRRLRRQARHLDAAAAGGRGVEARPPGALRLHAARSRWPSTTKRHPGAHAGDASRATREGRLHGVRISSATSTPAPTRRGAPTVANRVPIHAMRPVLRAERARARRARSTPTARSPGAFRGFGVPQSAIAHEALLDELAAAARHRPARVPPSQRARAPARRPRPGRCWRRAPACAQCLDALRPALAGGAARARGCVQRATPRAQAVRRGAGIACMWYGIGNTVDRQPVDDARRPAAATGASMLLQRRGRHRPGLEHRSCRRSAPTRSACRWRAFDQVMGDTDLTADAGKSSASRQTFVSGNAARLAGATLRAHAARARRGAPPTRELRLERRRAGRDATRTASDARSTCAELPARRRAATCSPARATSIRPPCRSMRTARACPTRPTASPRRSPRSRSTSSSARCKLLRIVAAHDVGRAINPTQVEGPDPRRHRAGHRPGADGGVSRRPDRQPARLPDPDRRRRAADRGAS